MNIRSRMIAAGCSAIRTEFVDLSFAENDSPIILGIRLIGNDTENRIEAALIGVLDYADEERRTVADVLQYCS
jgi:hypothetical protein